MKSTTVLLLTLSVFGTFAKQQSSTFQSSGFDGCYASSLPALNTHIQTPVVENPTVTFPTYVPPTSISESRHCLQTLVRPQIRNEIITVPTIDRIVRTIPSNPIVETINCGGGTRIATISDSNGLLSAVAGSLSEGARGNSNSGRNEVFNEMRGFATNAAGSNGVNIGLIARPTFFTIQNTSGRNCQGPSNAFTSNFSNNGRNNQESLAITK